MVEIKTGAQIWHDMAECFPNKSPLAEKQYIELEGLKKELQEFHDDEIKGMIKEGLTLEEMHKRCPWSPCIEWVLSLLVVSSGGETREETGTPEGERIRKAARRLREL